LRPLLPAQHLRRNTCTTAPLKTIEQRKNPPEEKVGFSLGNIYVSQEA